MSEKYSLKWNDYQTNWNKALNDLQTDTDLADVTLISDDKVEFSAHRIVLLSCSNMFKFIFKSNKNPNPLLFLGGVNSKNLRYILDYIYKGEVNIFQEQLDSFLESAQKLEIEGLLGDNQEYQENFNNEQSLSPKLEEEPNIFPHHQPSEKKSLARISDYENSPITRRQPRENAVINVESLTPEEIDTKMRELYEKTDDGWKCLACDHISKGKGSSNIRWHVEIHMDGLCFTCNLCDKEFRSRNSLNRHKNYTHKN